MKTLLTRVKDVIETNAVLSGYVKQVVIAPADSIPVLSITEHPFVVISPLDSSGEVWTASARKDVTHLIGLNLGYDLGIEETVLMGNSEYKGLLLYIEDVKDAVRGHRFPSGGVDYLSQPASIVSVRYTSAQYTDGSFLYMAMISLECVRQFVNQL